jgi:hypothetical protein
MTLDPKSLNAEERALVDQFVVHLRICDRVTDEQVYDVAVRRFGLSRLILARRAIFNAPEEASVDNAFGLDPFGKPRKVVCRNCNKLSSELHEFHGPMGSYFTCRHLTDGRSKPVPPPSPRAEIGGYQPIDHGGIKTPPQGGTGTVRPTIPAPAAASPLPEAVREALTALRRRSPEYWHNDKFADALESWALSLPRPSRPVEAVAQGAKVSPNDAVEVDALLFALEAASKVQFTVGMSPKEVRSWYIEGSQSAFVEGHKRAQAAAAGPRELPRVRELIAASEMYVGSHIRDLGVAALAELQEAGIP